MLQGETVVSTFHDETATRRASAGFGLIETVVSSGILVAVAAGVLHVMALCGTSVRAAATETAALTLAAQRMEQLRGLTWTYDPSLRPVSDWSSDLTVDPFGADGNGLRPSPPDSLGRNTAGYVDFLGASGEVIGSGPRPPPGTVFIRRWSIQHGGSGTVDSLVLQVVVLPLSRARRAGRSVPHPRDPGVVWLVSTKVRR